MGLLREILAEAFLLREDASVDSINTAVRNMHPATIVYNGPSGTGNGERVIYPVAYGISTAGNPVVRAFQPQGSTSSEVPAWKFFRLDRIKKWDNDLSRTFKPEDLSGFNENGDEQIETLYSIAPIGSAKVSPTKPSAEKENEPEKIITPHPVTKGEVKNGGADKSTEKEYYTADDAINDVLSTANPKTSPVLNKNIDNVAGTDYNSPETQPAREPVPVRKSELSGSEAEVPGESGSEESKTLYADNEPIMKSDLVKDEDNEQDSITGAFKDLNDRWDKLDKEEM